MPVSWNDRKTRLLCDHPPRAVRPRNDDGAARAEGWLSFVGDGSGYLIIHGGHDVLGKSQVSQVYDYAKAHGIDATLRFVEAEETGADHCQHDNPTIGQELMLDWLTDKLGIAEPKLRAKGGHVLDL
jgi:hypothetical protein